MARRTNAVSPKLDWRDRAIYQHITQIADRGWAWEGLRRNREFQDAWYDANSRFAVQNIEKRIRVVTSIGSEDALRRWGVLYSDPPNLDAGCAAVVWRPECARPLCAIALPAGSSLGLTSFELSDARCSIVVVDASDGYQHVLLHCAGGSVQLKVSGESVLQPVHLLVDAAPGAADLKSYLQTLAMFDAMRTVGTCESSERVSTGRSDRLRLVLRALDGFLEGATLREIAVALFGTERVEKDWDDDHRHLKDRTRRAVARGRWLMNGGYRKYLR